MRPRLGSSISPNGFKPRPWPPTNSADWYSGGNIGWCITLSFPDWANRYTLQSSPNLSPTSWTTATTARNVIKGQTMVTVTVGPGSQYFRLIR